MYCSSVHLNNADYNGNLINKVFIDLLFKYLNWETRHLDAGEEKLFIKMYDDGRVK